MKSIPILLNKSIPNRKTFPRLLIRHFVKYLIPALLWSPSFAQPSLSLEQAVQTALQNNPGIKSAEYQVEYFNELKKTSTDVGKLSAMWMHGQYNSIYQDNNVTISQTIPFPTTMSSQFQLGRAQVIGAQKNLQSARNDLVFEVKSVYYQLLYLESLKKLLLSQDSLYSDFANASSMRYSTGESNLLEKTTSETQWMEVKNLERQNGSDILIFQTRLQALLKSESRVVAAESLRKRELPQYLDTGLLAGNPHLNYLHQQVVISEQAKRVERNRILPDISVGYFVQSLTGLQNVNGQDIFFNRSKHFQGVELGLSIPLWIAPQLSKVNAAAIHEDVIRKNAEYYQVTLAGEYAQALQELAKNLSSLEYYESSALQNAALILSQARKAYKGGEINYLEYLQSLKNAIGIKSSYLQVLNQYNQSIVKIDFLFGRF
jgi:cobalt-zinc-cadmium resistance protein CzcA